MTRRQLLMRWRLTDRDHMTASRAVLGKLSASATRSGALSTFLTSPTNGQVLRQFWRVGRHLECMSTPGRYLFSSDLTNLGTGFFG